jgi:hypothetical protein
MQLSRNEPESTCCLAPNTLTEFDRFLASPFRKQLNANEPAFREGKAGLSGTESERKSALSAYMRTFLARSKSSAFFGSLRIGDRALSDCTASKKARDRKLVIPEVLWAEAPVGW